MKYRLFVTVALSLAALAVAVGALALAEAPPQQKAMPKAAPKGVFDPRADLRHAELVTSYPAGHPVAWWKADGNAKDSVGRNDGVLKGGVTYSGGCQCSGQAKGKSFDLNGSTGYVEVPYRDELAPSSLLVETCVYPRRLSPDKSINDPASEHVIAGIYDSRGLNTCHPRGGTPGMSWILTSLAGGYVEFAVYHHAPGSGAVTYRALVTNKVVLTTGKWQHVAASFDHTTQVMKIYIDGRPVPATLRTGSGTVTSLANPARTPLRIGAAVNYGGALVGFWDGLIDEVRVSRLH
jgi:hypothetical protein